MNGLMDGCSSLPLFRTLSFLMVMGVMMHFQGVFYFRGRF